MSTNIRGSNSGVPTTSTSGSGVSTNTTAANTNASVITSSTTATTTHHTSIRGTTTPNKTKSLRESASNINTSKDKIDNQQQQQQKQQQQQPDEQPIQSISKSTQLSKKHIRDQLEKKKEDIISRGIKPIMPHLEERFNNFFNNHLPELIVIYSELYEQWNTFKFMDDAQPYLSKTEQDCGLEASKVKKYTDIKTMNQLDTFLYLQLTANIIPLLGEILESLYVPLYTFSDSFEKQLSRINTMPSKKIPEAKVIKTQNAFKLKKYPNIEDYASFTDNLNYLIAYNRIDTVRSTLSTLISLYNFFSNNMSNFEEIISSFRNQQ
ncbi:hypothetical protein PPL_12556 [Heterostelium album PN500]|uniref:Uncharacterized protein n=1 Tax=Heterostelium pallidum (strain ATCC 26659 / Pp 5 / PN500) TaxID=670386 RepID=D3BMY3_HETP5|nr:hypothetical protein PPL_12556 [Heterostelium album PN500]EFA77345.1 hypothetical protein PPL_12556 [Heterostelium album PN500]|eukprot:XP_020429474.1 hypothetical protein PPL_12556 [Heterostelium album PN500]